MSAEEPRLADQQSGGIGAKRLNFSRDPFATESSGQSLISQEQEVEPYFDTGIPFIVGTINVPYEIVPQLYLLLQLFLAFLFEVPLTIRPILDFVFIWLYLRYFMRTYP